MLQKLISNSHLPRSPALYNDSIKQLQDMWKETLNLASEGLPEWRNSCARSLHLIEPLKVWGWKWLWDHLAPAHLPWAAVPFTRSGFSRPCWTWSWIFPGVGRTQYLQATFSRRNLSEQLVFKGNFFCCKNLLGSHWKVTNSNIFLTLAFYNFTALVKIDGFGIFFKEES